MQRAILHEEGTILKRAKESEPLSLVLDRTLGRPMCLQLCDFLRQAIMNRSLPPGYRLPSTRSLAERLRVSRNTVLNAYEELAAEGLIEGRIGSGTRVRVSVSRFRHLPVPNIPDLRTLLRQAHYPVAAAGICDPDGTPLYLHR
jgi:DNA-binding transcriptional MocR family regulator